MKKALLITSKNFLYRDALVRAGYTVVEYGPSLSATQLAEIGKAPADELVIAEATPPYDEKCVDLFALIGKRKRVLCLADEATDALKWFLIDNGISDLLVKYDRETFGEAVRVIGEETDGDAGTFLVLDDNAAFRKILRNIVTRFNYRTTFAETTAELLEMVSRSGVRFVLVNLGSKALDLNGLVRKFYASPAVREVPVVAYKDMRNGLFVHELVGGLNRLTRYILSIEELCSLLVDILYRKELIPLVASIKKVYDFEANACYDGETLNKAFFLLEKNIFNQTNLLDEGTRSLLSRNSQGIQNAIHKVESIKWLKIGTKKK